MLGGMQAVFRPKARAGNLLMGMCLGMKLRFEKSVEYGVHEGLGLIHGISALLDPDVP